MNKTEIVTSKNLVAQTNNVTRAKIYLKSTHELAMEVVFEKASTQSMNGAYLDKVMKLIEGYLRDVKKNISGN